MTHPLFDLTGKTAFITGASAGLGAHLAECLSRAGACVILAARRLHKLEALALKLQNALPIAMDVADHESIQKGFAHLEQLGEKIDICVNNAGTAKWTPLFLDEIENYDAFEKGGIEVWDEVMQVNLRGTWLVTQHVATHMKKYGIYGSIINIGSTIGDKRPVAGGAAASVSKAGVIHLTKQLVPELAHHHIRINCLVPGLFWTELTQEQLKKRGDEIMARTPLGFIGEPQDFEGALLYLASNAASRYVTGACITIDGGISV